MIRRSPEDLLFYELSEEETKIGERNGCRVSRRFNVYNVVGVCATKLEE